MAGPEEPSEGLGEDDPTGELATIRDWLRWSVSRFNEAGLVYGHGTGNAVDEAAFLILETLRLPIDGLEPWLDARLTRQERARVHSIVQARIDTRKPASYLTGSAYIQGRRFRVDERVIVPRSFIGELIGTGRLDEVLGEPPLRVLDLCTGSACLAILAAIAWPQAQVDAVELSADALEIARVNVAAYAMQDRVRLLEGDLFGPVSGQRYDLIVANPPYVALGEVEAFAPEYAAEPRLAHLGGADGLDLARRILATAGTYLAPQGALVMEIGTGAHILEAEMPDMPFLWLDTEGSEGEVLLIGADALGVPKERPKAGGKSGKR